MNLMNRKFEFSPKQLEYIRNADHKWNGKIGATRCGKTTLDVMYMIPSRIIERLGFQGIGLILGVSKSTIERNILAPMREIWGERLIGEINSENKAVLFGEEYYCLGTEKANAVSKIRGLKAKYVYWDEICEANEEVFELVKSRIELDYACVDFTANPKDPNHFVKKFIDKEGIDIYVQTWTIFDNPFLSPTFINELCKQYEGSIFYDRYILGQWKRAEGAIYRVFCDNVNKYLINELPRDFDYSSVRCGIDFGGNGSAHAFIAVGYTMGFRDIVIFDEQLIKDALTPQELEKAYVQFANRVYNKVRKVFITYYDNAEPVLARGIAEECRKAQCQTLLKGAWKCEILERIRLTISMMGTNRLKIMRNCHTIIQAFQDAVWNPKKVNVDERLDDGTYCVDILDAFEYCIERDMKMLIHTNN